MQNYSVGKDLMYFNQYSSYITDEPRKTNLPLMNDFCRCIQTVVNPDQVIPQCSFILSLYAPQGEQSVLRASADNNDPHQPVRIRVFGVRIKMYNV